MLLFNIPATVHPAPPPEMETLLVIAGILELVDGHLVCAGPCARSVDNARRARIAAGA